MRIVLIEMVVLAVIGCVFPVEGFSTESGWNEVGVRMGIQAGSKIERFHQFEAFGVYGLPWEWRTSSGWGLTPQLNASAGVLYTNDETGVIGTAGTALSLNKPGFGLAPEVGIAVDLLDRRQFGKQDFGTILQFGAYLGFSYLFDSGLKLGYRIHHMSNAHVFYRNGTPNPSLDQHMIGISYVFR